MMSLRSRIIFSNADLLLIAIESVVLRHNKTSAGGHCHGNIEPHAIIVITPSDRYALDMSAKKTSIDRLRQDMAELDATINLFTGDNC